MKTINIKHTAECSALLNEQCIKNRTTDVSGSTDSPLFPGLPAQKTNIAEGNATWF
jgi:hypothetical protein